MIDLFGILVDYDTTSISGMDEWDGLFVPKSVLKALKELNFTAPTPIQKLALPSAIRDKLDILGAAETVIIPSFIPPIPLIHVQD